MKKLLAIILAAAMLISLVPSVFAEGEAESLSFEMSAAAIGLSKATNSSKVTDDDYAKANWDYIGVSGTNNFYYLLNGIVRRNKRSTVDVAGDNAVVYKITVNEAGVYTPSVTYNPNKYGILASYYLISSGEATSNNWDLTSSSYWDDAINAGNSGTAGIKIASIETNQPVTTSTDYVVTDSFTAFTFDQAQTVELDCIKLEATDYYFIITGDLSENTVTFDYSGSTFVYNLFKSLKLTEVLPAAIEASVDQTQLEVGSTAAVSSVVTGDNGETIDADVTYTSSAPEIASVDSATGVVTANAIGEATITAATKNGITDTVQISVADIKSYKFILSSMIDDFVNGETNIVLDKEGANDGEYYENIKDGEEKWDVIHAYGVQTLRLYKNNFSFRMKRGATITPNINGITYKINVPEAGKYELNLNYFEDECGLITGVWFVDEAMLAEKNITMAGTGSNLGCRLIMSNFTPDIEVDTYRKGIGTDDSNPDRDVLTASSGKVYNLAAGEYYIVLGITGKNEGFDNTSLESVGASSTDGPFSYMLYEGVDLVKVGEYEAPVIPELDDEVHVFVHSQAEGAVTSEDVKIGDVTYVPVGSSITVEAEKTYGDYTFVGWTDSAGNFVSEKEKETFDIITKTALIAVYDKAPAADAATAAVEFWNRNGTLIGTETVDAGKTFGEIDKPEASLNGYGDATGWSISDDTVISGTVRAVAEYAYEDTGAATKTVTVNGAAVESPVYNQLLTPSLEGATYWTRNAKTVAFGESFTHYIFNSANGTAITASKGAVTVRPVVTIDINSDGAAMIEYDKADKEIVEAGILFGAEGVSLDSYTSKAVVKNLRSHGQFIAAPNENTSLSQDAARGYLIYKDGSSYKIVYSN